MAVVKSWSADQCRMIENLAILAAHQKISSFDSVTMNLTHLKSGRREDWAERLAGRREGSQPSGPEERQSVCSGSQFLRNIALKPHHHQPAVLGVVVLEESCILGFVNRTRSRNCWPLDLELIPPATLAVPIGTAKLIVGQFYSHSYIRPDRLNKGYIVVADSSVHSPIIINNNRIEQTFASVVLIRTVAHSSAILLLFKSSESLHTRTHLLESPSQRCTQTPQNHLLSVVLRLIGITFSALYSDSSESPSHRCAATHRNHLLSIVLPLIGINFSAFYWDSS
ncbi:hypothetical protein PGT21_028148 [Puccinia graminis f. sp. tritici]|uniref:Uncharacterized protein n=1 Tax=Puccinia graminis f. sp. tritici TaxID=56615 RepID=A0A5B0N9I8_PUCGR|nr:hypothetical protein PGT21_028148 [Puccinia graminis f. sp. tritici]KAA1132993.1 hypothetical protein PGTUg99_019216 [Puccinia graminis f. sp. tritici]